MRTTASLAAFVALMAVTSSNGAPIGTLNGSSAHSVSCARAQLGSRHVRSLTSGREDVSYTADVPNLECSDCREKEVKKVLAGVAKPMTDMGGDLKDAKNTLFSADAQASAVPSGTGSVGTDADVGDDEDSTRTSADFQVPGVTSSSGTIDIDVDLDDNEDPNTGASTRPEEHANDDDNSSNNSASDGTANGANDDGKTNDGKTDPPAEQPPHDESNIDLGDEPKEVNKVIDGEAHDLMDDVKSKSTQADDDVKATLSSTNDDVHELNGDVNEVAKVVTVSQEPGSEKPEDCENEITVEMRKGNPSVSTSGLRR